MSTMNGKVHDALVDAGANATKAREAAESVARYDTDIGDIKTNLADIRASLRIIQWMFGFTLAFIMAVTWRVFQ